MSTRRISRYRPLRSKPSDGSGLRRLQLRGGAVLLALGALVIAAMLYLAQNYWAAYQIDKINAELNNTYFGLLDQVERHWLALPHLAELKAGDEKAAKDFVESQPLVIALQDRWNDRSLWIRSGDHLEPADPGAPELQHLRNWITQAEMAQRFQWAPTDDQKPDPLKQPVIVLLGDRWIAVKQWRLGSPEVEKALRLALSPQASIRVGIKRKVGPVPPNREPWGAEPNLQVDPARLDEPLFGISVTATTFEGWELWSIPFRAQALAYRDHVIKQRWLGRGFALLIGATLGLGLWLRRRAQARAVLDADRLASLTHSLKTPLAILKFRCDSLRLGRLGPDEADLELMKLGDEVDRLSLIIETGLAAIRGSGGTGPLTTVTPGWLSEVAEDLAPAFEAEGRTLSLDLCPEEGLADRPGLRSTLLTLLENALFHGAGRVILKSHRVRRRLQILIQDEGPGLEPHQLEALGKPFLRLRADGKEGFRREGQGLGLSLIFQMAMKEGWGLSLSSAPGQGLTATLEIPLAL